MIITPNFTRQEFDCKDGTPYPEEWIESRLRPLCEAIEVIREVAGGKPINITSAYRTEAHNKKVGGAKNSEHVKGRAVDIVCRGKGMTAEVLHTIILRLIGEKKIPDGGVGLYHSWVHYDQRGCPARWRG
mgnify:CR=1 FL=1